MKEKLLIMLLCFAFVLPVSMAEAQESGIDGAQITNTAVSLLDRVIAIVAQVGAVFGDKLGIHIGTTGMAIALIVVAIFFGNRMPSLLKWLLIIVGVTMLAGGAANILQIIKRAIGQ